MGQGLSVVARLRPTICQGLRGILRALVFPITASPRGSYEDRLLVLRIFSLRVNLVATAPLRSVTPFHVNLRWEAWILSNPTRLAIAKEEVLGAYACALARRPRLVVRLGELGAPALSGLRPCRS